MTIERSNSEIIIRIPGNVDTEVLQRLINFLIYREVTADTYGRCKEVYEF